MPSDSGFLPCRETGSVWRNFQAGARCVTNQTAAELASPPHITPTEMSELLRYATTAPTAEPARANPATLRLRERYAASTASLRRASACRFESCARMACAIAPACVLFILHKFLGCGLVPESCLARHLHWRLSPDCRVSACHGICCNIQCWPSAVRQRRTQSNSPRTDNCTPLNAQALCVLSTRFRVREHDSNWPVHWPFAARRRFSTRPARLIVDSAGWVRRSDIGAKLRNPATSRSELGVSELLGCGLLRTRQRAEITMAGLTAPR